MGRHERSGIRQHATGSAFARLGSVVVLILVWWAAALFADSRNCPAPPEVFGFIVKEIVSGEMLRHFAATLARVAAAFFAAMAIGCAIGLAMGRSRAVDLVLEPWIILLLNAPALILIVLAYIWIGLNETAAILAVALNKIPNVVITIREGARAMEPTYLEMAKVYRFSRRSLLLDVMLPQLQPYIAAAARSGLALIWKIVLVVELLGRSSGVGFKISLYFQTFDVRAILGYTIVFVLLMLLVEYLWVQPLERRAYRWRPRPA